MSAIPNFDEKARHLRELVSQAVEAEREPAFIRNAHGTPLGELRRNHLLAQLASDLAATDALHVLNELLNGEGE